MVIHLKLVLSGRIFFILSCNIFFILEILGIKSKKLYDKRQQLKDRDIQRDMQRHGNR